jgi:hypothetical protein
MMADSGRSLFEKHLQTFLLGLLSVLLMWNVAETSDTGKAVIKISGRLDALEGSLASRMLDRYTGTQAESQRRYEALQHQTLKKRFADDDVKMREFEKRFDVLEKKGSDTNDH